MRRSLRQLAAKWCAWPLERDNTSIPSTCRNCWRSLPRRGDPSSAIGSVLHELTRPPAGPGDGPAGPWLPADEAEAAALLAAAFAGRAPGVVPIATTSQMDVHVMVRRIADGRVRVPERAPVRREDRRDWRAMHQIEPPTGMLESVA